MMHVLTRDARAHIPTHLEAPAGVETAIVIGAQNAVLAAGRQIRHPHLTLDIT